MATQGQIQPTFPYVQMPISTAEDDVIEVDANNLQPVTIPRHNTGSKALLQFFMTLCNALYVYCEEALAGVDFELITDKINDIYDQIWCPSGLKKCPAYMRDDNGRLMKSCLILYPTKVGQQIILTASEWATVLFIMACMRHQSTKGRRTPPEGMSAEDFKEILRRKNIELNAEDILDRMKRLLIFNIRQYYVLDINDETGCVTISPKENQSFDNIDQEEVFKAFMEKNKRTQPSKKRKREESDVESSQESEQSEKKEKRPRKVMKVDQSLTSGPHDAKPRKCKVAVNSSLPTAQPVVSADGFNLQQVLQGHLDYNKVHNPAANFNAAVHLMNIVREGFKYRGMSESDAQKLVIEQSLTAVDPQYRQWLQSQGYYPQPQLSVSQQTPHVTFKHDSHVEPRPRTAPHDVYGAPPSPNVTDVFKDVLDSVIQETGGEFGQDEVEQAVCTASLPQQHFSLAADPVNDMAQISFPNDFSSTVSMESLYNDDAYLGSASDDLFQSMYSNFTEVQANSN